MCNGRQRRSPGLLGLARYLVLAACIVNDAAGQQSQVQQSEIAGRVLIEAPVAKNAFAVITLSDVTLADAPSEQISQIKVTTISGNEFAFTLPFEKTMIAAGNRYIVSAEIYERNSDGTDQRTFITTQSYPVLTHGAGRSVVLRAQRIR